MQTDLARAFPDGVNSGTTRVTVPASCPGRRSREATGSRDGLRTRSGTKRCHQAATVLTLTDVKSIILPGLDKL